jgi:hypothetical protein
MDTKRSGGSSQAALGAYFVVVREVYEAAAARTKHEATPGIRDILSRAPLRSPDQTSVQYEAALGSAVSWSDCFALELETVDAYPDAELADQLRAQRIRYSQMAPADEFATYMKGAVDLQTTLVAAAPIPFDRLRSELAMVVGRIAYLLTLSAPKESVRGWLTLWTVLLMLGGMALIFACYYAVYHSYYRALAKSVASAGTAAFIPSESLFLVLFAGLIGGFVSVQQRLQQPTVVDPIFKRLELEASGFSIIASPVIGMIFAAVLFALMLAKLVSTSIFPDFICPPGNLLCAGNDLAAFASSATPADSASWAKLAVWAFAAGFLERLVPDILTRLSTVATSKS